MDGSHIFCYVNLLLPLTITRQQNFNLVQTESISRQPFLCSSNCLLDKKENIVANGERLVTSIFSFSQNVFKSTFPLWRQKLS